MPHSIDPLERFSLRPFQECSNTYITNHICENSHVLVFNEADTSTPTHKLMLSVKSPSSRRMSRNSIGWVWKGDPNRGAKLTWSNPLTEKHLLEIADQVSTVWVYGQDSVLCGPNVVDFVQETCGDKVGIVGIPGAQHHVFLDQPIGLISALMGIFSQWHLEAPSNGVGQSYVLEASL